MATNTVKELIQDSLTMLMVYSPDVILTAEESNTALRTLNSLIESLANESFTINTVTKENFNLVGGQATYTFGTGGNLTARALSALKQSQPRSLVRLAISIFPLF